jgi:hypothetical protein
MGRDSEEEKSRILNRDLERIQVLDSLSARIFSIIPAFQSKKQEKQDPEHGLRSCFPPEPGERKIHDLIKISYYPQ